MLIPTLALSSSSSSKPQFQACGEPLRWHPDKFIQKFGTLLGDSEREEVSQLKLNLSLHLNLSLSLKLICPNPNPILLIPVVSPSPRVFFKHIAKYYALIHNVNVPNPSRTASMYLTPHEQRQCT